MTAMGAGSALPGTPLPTHAWVTTAGLELAGDAWGEPGGRPVVLLHGGGQTRHAWKGTGERLADIGYHVLAFDARGHGDSDWATDGDYSLSAMVDDLATVVAGLDRPPILVGASLGGIVSLTAVGSRRITAAGLVLVDIAPRIEPEGVQRIREFMFARPDGFASLDEVADAVAAYQPHRPRPRDLVGLAKNVRQGDDGRYRWHWDPRFMTGPQRVNEHGYELDDLARAVDIPTLLVRGAMSDLVSEEGARHFLEVCPHADYVDVAGASHMVAGDRNDVFADAVIGFLTTRVPSTAR